MKSDVPLLKDKKWNQAIEFADEANKIVKTERWSLIAELRPSDDEDFDQFQEQEDEISPKNLNQSPKKDSFKTKTPKGSHSKEKSDLKRKVSHRDGDRSHRKKFKKLVLDSSEDEFESESEDDYKPQKSDESSDDEEVLSVDIAESEVEDMSVEDIDSESDSESKKSNALKSKLNNESKSSPRSPYPLFSKGSNRSKSSDTPKVKSINKLNKSRLSIAEDSFISVNETMDQNCDKIWPHLGFEFLKPEKLKDNKEGLN